MPRRPIAIVCLAVLLVVALGAPLAAAPGIVTAIDSSVEPAPEAARHAVFVGPAFALSVDLASSTPHRGPPVQASSVDRPENLDEEETWSTSSTGWPRWRCT